MIISKASRESCSIAGRSSAAVPPRAEACNSSHRKEYRPGARIDRWLSTALLMRAVCRVAAAVYGMAPTRARRTHLRGCGSRSGLPSASSSPATHSVWAACVSSASTAMSCYGCVSATRSVHATSLSHPVVSLPHSCCLQCDVLRAAVCCHVRVTVLQCAVMSACSHPLTRCVSSRLSHSATHAVQIAISHCRVQVDRIIINRGFLLFSFQ